ncbi:marR family transcriptional regulator [endosymbiont of Euscepes postfasciatus]|uniref:MarR family winged helix-turn-helix transcriptional regulator n=1 Tax=endosymbiont of Euscepes postfasciatus TaxID=650377 RepID=UPI000DC6D683|nr:winged helix DNA-binding protein [endosymbiont of Euscepes postfasciatus]BBA84566.1 marR family transcriptional regulator [endosymbiont of Euscepes postfasciatus]
MNKVIDVYSIVEILFNIYNKLKKEINKNLINDGLSISKMKILRFINSKKTSATDIKNYMEFSSRTIVTVLDSLEKENLLYRKQSKQDRRIKYVYITEKGLKKLKLAEIKHKIILNKSFSSLTKMQIENFYEICESIENKNKISN